MAPISVPEGYVLIKAGNKGQGTDGCFYEYALPVEHQENYQEIANILPHHKVTGDDLDKIIRKMGGHLHGNRAAVSFRNGRAVYAAQYDMGKMLGDIVFSKHGVTSVERKFARDGKPEITKHYNEGTGNLVRCVEKMRQDDCAIEIQTLYYPQSEQDLSHRPQSRKQFICTVADLCRPRPLDTDTHYSEMYYDEAGLITKAIKADGNVASADDIAALQKPIMQPT